MNLFGKDTKEEEEEIVVKKKISPFELLKAITIDKNLDSVDYKPSDLIFLLKLMSFHPRLFQHAANVSEWVGIIDNKQILKSLESVLPKESFFIKYPSKTKVDEDKLKLIANYFKISTTEAQEYLDIISMMGEEVYRSFINNFNRGGIQRGKKVS